MTSPDFTIKQGDYHRRLQLTLADLATTDATGVTFRMKARGGTGLVVNRAGTINSASQVSLQFQAPELDTPGLYDLEVSLTFIDGSETVPTSGYIRVVVEPKLA